MSGFASKSLYVDHQYSTLWLVGGYDCNPSYDPLRSRTITNVDLRVMGGAEIYKNMCVGGNVMAKLFIGNVCSNLILVDEISDKSGNGILVTANVTIEAPYTLDVETLKTELITNRSEETDLIIMPEGNVIICSTDSGKAYVCMDIILEGNLLPSANVLYNLGDMTHKWKTIVTDDLIVCGNTNIMGNGGPGGWVGTATSNLNMNCFVISNVMAMHVGNLFGKSPINVHDNFYIRDTVAGGKITWEAGIEIGDNSTVSTTNVGIAIGRFANSNSSFAIGIGQGSFANGAYAVAIGYNAQAKYNRTIAIGRFADANYIDSIAIGNFTNAYSEKSISLGSNAGSYGYNSISIGSFAYTDGESSVVIGSRATCAYDQTIAIGSGRYNNTNYYTGARSTKIGAISIGSALYSEGGYVNGPYAKGISSIAIGSGSQRGLAQFDQGITFAGNVDCIAIGRGAFADGVNVTYSCGSVAIGVQSYATKIGSVSIGANSYAKGEYSIGIRGRAVGDNSVSLSNGLSGGYNSVAIKGIAGGTNCISIIGSAGGFPAEASCISIGAGSAVKYGCVQIGHGNFVGSGSGGFFGSGSDSVGIGSNILVYSRNSIAIGTSPYIGNAVFPNFDNAYQSIALGFNPGARGNDCVAIGTNSYIGLSGNRSIAIGYNTTVNSFVTDAIALGSNTTASSNGGFFVQHNTTVTGSYNNAVFNNATKELIEITSSMRFKEQIRDLEPTLDNIDKIRPVRYRAKPGHGNVNKDVIGLIAEELVGIYPEFVSQDAEGLPAGIAYDQMVSLLIKELQAIRERERKNNIANQVNFDEQNVKIYNQNEIIVTLQNQINDLMGRINKLESNAI